MCTDSSCEWWQSRSSRFRPCPFRSTPSSVNRNGKSHVLQHADAFDRPHVAEELGEYFFDVGICVVESACERGRTRVPYDVELARGHVPRDLRIFRGVEPVDDLPVVVFSEVANGGTGVVADGVHVVGRGEPHVHRLSAELDAVHDQRLRGLRRVRELDERFGVVAAPDGEEEQRASHDLHAQHLAETREDVEQLVGEQVAGVLLSTHDCGWRIWEGATRIERRSGFVDRRRLARSRSTRSPLRSPCSATAFDSLRETVMTASTIATVRAFTGSVGSFAIGRIHL